jgi:hypothetical protein
MLLAARSAFVTPQPMLLSHGAGENIKQPLATTIALEVALMELLQSAGVDVPTATQGTKSKVIWDSIYRETPDGYGFIYEGNSSRLLTNAVALRLLLSRPLNAQSARRAARLAAGIQLLYSPEVGFALWFLPPPGGDATLLANPAASHEAVRALAEYGQRRRQSDALAIARDANAFYWQRWKTEGEQSTATQLLRLSRNFALIANADTTNWSTLAMFEAGDQLQRLTPIWMGHANECSAFSIQNAARTAMAASALVAAWRSALSARDTTRSVGYKMALNVAVDCLLAWTERPEGVTDVGSKDSSVTTAFVSLLVDALRTSEVVQASIAAR